MGSSKRNVRKVPLSQFGVSFSVKQCRNFGIDPLDTLSWLINNMEFRRFRLMSYWNEHEKSPGHYDFTELDKQIALIEKAGGHVSLCLGVRQPRWPENHWPKWALKLPLADRYTALFKYIQIVVERYKNHPAIVNYQLENEALNRNFGKNGDFNRSRLRTEFHIVKSLDPHKNIVMSTSNSWGLPLRYPTPDLIGFSIYRVVYEKNRYKYSLLPVSLYKLRALFAKLLIGRECFIHELQLEPWGPEGIWDMSLDEQNISMDIDRIKSNIRFARSTGQVPIDLWGGEWWYWRLVKYDDPFVSAAVLESIAR